MSQRVTRTIKIALPGGRTSAESLAHIIDTVFARGLESGERIDSIRGYVGDMAETVTLDIVVSAPGEFIDPQAMGRDLVDDQRR
jgi:hypothetical protein